MAPSLFHEPIRKLPLWQAGYAHGRDVGPRLALDALTGERTRQAQRLAAERESGSPTAACLTYAAGCLLDVSKTVAGEFLRTAR